MARKRPNIVDILIVVVLVGVIALSVYKFAVVDRREAGSVETAAVTTTYSAFIDEVRMPTVEALHEGDKMFDEKTGNCIGTIKTVSHTPMYKNILDKNGAVKKVEYPDYYSVTLTIEGAILEKQDGYFVDGIVELKANSEMNTYTKYVKPVIKVTAIDM